MNELPLFAWAAARPAPRAAEIVDLAKFRETSPRWLLEIQPRETVEQGLLALDRVLGLAPTIPVAEFRRA